MRRSRNFARSDYGVGYAQLLQSYGKTAEEWGELPPDVRLFHELAWQEEQRRQEKEQERLESKY